MQESARSPREPWLAVAWSFVWPGLGQVVTGSPRIGWAVAFAQLALLVLGIAAYASAGMSLAIFAAAFAALGVLTVVAPIAAYRVARASTDAAFDAERRAQRDAWKAVVLGRILPGVGHLYDGRVAAGLGLVALAVAAALVPGLAGGLLVAALTAFASFDAWRGARGRRSGTPAAAWRVGLASGDDLTADMRAHGAGRFGDIVVYRSGFGRGELWVKRVLGEPGDTIEFRGDDVLRNGAVVARGLTPDVSGMPPRFAVGEPYRVPADSLFLIGDDLGNSLDSRWTGPVAKSAVVGRAFRIYWPPNHVRRLDGPPAGPPWTARAR